MPTDAVHAGGDVIRRCLAMGFAYAGIAPAQPTRWRAEVLAWLAAGNEGSMAWLHENIEARLDPGVFMDGAKSVVMVAERYAARGDGRSAEESDAVLASPIGPRGRVARYAQGRDYHVVMRKRLYALAAELRGRFAPEKFYGFVDIAPILEREHAMRAGLGWIGKNTMLIHPRGGSYLMLGGIMTTMWLDPPREQAAVMDHCGSCMRCIDACPTGAITPYQVDARRCISYLTIEQRGEVDPALHAGIGDWLFGCDVCQEVCPHNSARLGGGSTDTEARVADAYAPARPVLGLLDVLGWSADDRSSRLSGSSMKRATLPMLKRNALIVTGNILAELDDATLRARIEELAADEREDPAVRRTAGRVLSRLGGGDDGERRG
ncbi:MAG: tRNA epoxyqueuosine(34) reductase QueG [Phycisphaerales bacterium]|nr:tRNA epoxyqueuosine(34) reductase QueG [Phycisphaerales bacterium]